MPVSARPLALFCALMIGLPACKDGSSSGGGGRRTLEQIQAEVAVKEQALRDRVVPGKEVPELTLTDLSGKPFVLASLRGKLVLINLWATWCVPCINEMPSLQRLYDKLHSRGLEIVAISVDAAEDKQLVEKFVTKNQLTFPVLLDPEMTVPELLGVAGYPESFFVSQDGNFLEVLDIESEERVARIEGDRVWNSTDMLNEVEKLIPKQ